MESPYKDSWPDVCTCVCVCVCNALHSYYSVLYQSKTIFLSSQFELKNSSWPAVHDNLTWKTIVQVPD